MTSEILIERKKRKKTYEELLEEAKSLSLKIARSFLPELCKALKEENPTWSNDRIKERVFEDCSDIWSIEHIRRWLPDWVKEQKFAELGRLGAQKSAASMKQARAYIPEEQEDEEQEEEYKYEFESVEAVKPPNQEHVGSFYSDGIETADELVKILTHQDRQVAKLDDVEKSRNYRLQSMKRMSESDLNRMHNYLSFLKEVINDILPMIDKELETKQEKDKLMQR